VKLLDRNARAGLQSHNLLADADLAPRLLGTAELNGAEFAAVMAYLAPENAAAVPERPSEVEMNVGHPGLRKALWVMKEGKVVHGGFRPYNIMVRSKNGEDEKQGGEDVEMSAGGHWRLE
jgi:hypothetical protein